MLCQCGRFGSNHWTGSAGRAPRAAQTMLQYVLNRPYMVTAQQRAQAQLDLERNPAWAKKLQLTRVMASHDGCVNSVRWRGDGLLLCSGSDDRCVCVWDRRGALVGKKKTTHAHNIFDAAFVPGSSAIATAAADGRVGLVEAWDGDQPARTLYASRDYGCIASKLSFVPDCVEIKSSTRLQCERN